MAAVPISAAARQLAALADEGPTALEHALEDGEDFELILAAAPAEARRLLKDQPLPVPISRVGRFVAKSGLWRRTADGARQPLSPRGYLH